MVVKDFTRKGSDKGQNAFRGAQKRRVACDTACLT